MTAGFVKLDCEIVDSSLWVQRDLRSLFITALLMARPCVLDEPVPQLRVRSLEPTGWMIPPGRYGLVRAAGSAIVRRDGIDPEWGLAALEALGEPDPESRSQEFDGRRLVRVNHGYVVLNYARYRDKDYTAAERAQRYRDAKRDERRDGVTNGDSSREPRDAGVTQRDSYASASAVVVDLEKQELPARQGPAEVYVWVNGYGDVGLPDFGKFNGLVEGFIRAQHLPEAVVATLRMHLDGEMGHVKATPTQLGLAVQQYSTAQGIKPFSPLYFAGFVRRAIGLLAGDTETKRLAAEAVETRQRAAEEEEAGQFVARYAADHPDRYATILAGAEQMVEPGIIGRSFLVRAKVVELVREAINAAR